MDTDTRPPSCDDNTGRSRPGTADDGSGRSRHAVLVCGHQIAGGFRRTAISSS